MVGIYSNLNNGVYKILNTVNNKCYIGSTVQGFSQRWTQHRTLLYRNIHTNNYLQNAWNKYGKENFVFIQQEVLNEETNINKIREREQYWIDNLKPEYNLSAVSLYGEMSDCGKYRVGYAKGTKAELISPEGIHYCSLSLAWFAQDFNLNAGTLQSLCNGTLHHYKKWKGSVILEDGTTPYLHTKKKNTALKYLITNPKGVQMCTWHIKSFCEEYNINLSHLMNTANPNSQRSQTQGWKAIQINKSTKHSTNKYIYYIKNIKTKDDYIIGNIDNYTHKNLFVFCNEFNLLIESIYRCLNQKRKLHKDFLIYRHDIKNKLPTKTFLDTYFTTAL